MQSLAKLKAEENSRHTEYEYRCRIRDLEIRETLHFIVTVLLVIIVGYLLYV